MLHPCALVEVPWSRKLEWKTNSHHCQKKRDEAQTITNESLETQVLTYRKSGAKDQCQDKSEVNTEIFSSTQNWDESPRLNWIFLNQNSRTDLAAHLIDVDLVELHQSHLWLLTSKVANILRKNRKWISHIRTGKGMIVYMEEKSESVAACAQIKDDIKQVKTTWLIQSSEVHTGDHVFTKVILLFSLALKQYMFSNLIALWRHYGIRKADHVCFQGHTWGETMSAVPAMSSFIFRFAVFFLFFSINSSTFLLHFFILKQNKK